MVARRRLIDIVGEDETKQEDTTDMGILNRLKSLRTKAEEAAVEHKDQLHKAVGKAEKLVDQRTQGKYHDKIAKVADQADSQLDGLASREGDASPPAGPATDGPAHPAP